MSNHYVLQQTDTTLYVNYNLKKNTILTSVSVMQAEVSREMCTEV